MAPATLNNSTENRSHPAPVFHVRPEEIRAIKKNYREFRINIPGVALWELDLRSGSLRGGVGLAALLERDTASLPETLEQCGILIPEEEREAVRRQLNEHLLGHTPFFKIRHHLTTATGRKLWCITCGRVTLRNREGLPERLVGSTCEAVFYQRNQRRLGRIMRALSHERRSHRAALAKNQL